MMKQARHWFMLMGSLVVICLAGCLGGSSPKTPEAGLNEEFYLAYNVWYEQPLRVFAINYKVGAILPIGSKVTYLGKVEGRHPSFQFRSADGVVFQLYLTQKFWPGVSLDMVKERLLTKTPVDQLLSQYPADHQAAIKRGEVVPGMSRAAVRQSWGYAPSHVNPVLEAQSYLYWYNRFKTMQVTFDANGLVEQVRR